MAATLDINIITTNSFSIFNIVQYLNEFYDFKIQILKISQIDTERYPELDTDIGNKDIYLKIFGEIDQMIKKFGYRVDVIAAGIETNLVYHKDRKEMIKKSYNINAWSFDKSIIIDDLLEFNHSRIGDRDIFIVA